MRRDKTFERRSIQLSYGRIAVKHEASGSAVLRQIAVFFGDQAIAVLLTYIAAAPISAFADGKPRSVDFYPLSAGACRLAS